MAVPFCRPRGCGDPYVVTRLDSRLRGNDGGHGNDTFLVAPAEAGVHASNQVGKIESRDYGSK